MNKENKVWEIDENANKLKCTLVSSIWTLSLLLIAIGICFDVVFVNYVMVSVNRVLFDAFTGVVFSLAIGIWIACSIMFGIWIKDINTIQRFATKNKIFSRIFKLGVAAIVIPFIGFWVEKELNTIFKHFVIVEINTKKTQFDEIKEITDKNTAEKIIDIVENDKRLTRNELREINEREGSTIVDVNEEQNKYRTDLSTGIVEFIEATDPLELNLIISKINAAFDYYKFLSSILSNNYCRVINQELINHLMNIKLHINILKMGFNDITFDSWCVRSNADFIFNYQYIYHADNEISSIANYVVLPFFKTQYNNNVRNHMLPIVKFINQRINFLQEIFDDLDLKFKFRISQLLKEELNTRYILKMNNILFNLNLIPMKYFK